MSWTDCPTCGAGACIGPRDTCTRVPEAALSSANRRLVTDWLGSAALISRRSATFSIEELETLMTMARDEERRDATNWRPISDPPKGEMFIVARPKGSGKWGLGLAYWTVSGSWVPTDGTGRVGITHCATLPPPPR